MKIISMAVLAYVMGFLALAAAVPSIPPSMLLPVDAATVCEPGYASRVRNVPESVKRKICKPKTDCVVDHVISIEVGGSNDPSNLAAQSKATAHEKDILEDQLHGQVCHHMLMLDDARKQLWLSWGHQEGKW